MSGFLDVFWVVAKYALVFLAVAGAVWITEKM